MPDKQSAIESFQTSLENFLGKAVADLGAAMSAVLVTIGDELGLYKELAKAALSPAELAEKTQTNERYVREWLNNQAAGGYVSYDRIGGRYYLNEVQAACLADPDGPVDLPGAYLVIEDLFHVRERALQNFKSGAGMEWGEHHNCLFHGTERFFPAGYNAHLIGEWLPALGGVVEKLRSGARVADVGCGRGASTILMATTYPKSQFVGFDYHPQSIEAARDRAKQAGANNARFEVADATNYSDKQFDLIAFFDCLHDMADPAGAARHACEALKTGGKCMIVEPFASDRTEDNFNSVGRTFYAASTMVCVPVSLARQGPALGAQAGEKRLRDIVVSEAGFSSLRRAAETPFNLVFEATL